MPSAAPTAAMSPRPWRPLGRYELGPRLATGGMAELYLARTPEVHGFRKYLAVKRILPKWADDHEFVEMFLDEARLAAQLDHPNVMHVHDIGEDGDGFYFTMDYVHGQNLAAIVQRAKARGTPLPWAAFVALGAAAAAGLHHAHERRGFDGRPLGIIHRDVSPTNILVSDEGVVKLVDFGIAKASTSRHSTRPSVRKGKMAYMSPEQCRGDALDRRSDVFALGVVLYELATLGRAFDGEGEFAVMNQIVNHDLPPPSSRRADVPSVIDRLIARAVSRDPQARPSTARELQRALETYAVEAGLTATPEALAVVMQELFGATPYPWETTDAGAVDDASAATPTAATRVRAATPEATGATVAKPMPAAPVSTPAPPKPVPRRRATWWLGGLLAAGAASLAWAFTRPDAAPQPSATVEPTRAAIESPAPFESPTPRPMLPSVAPTPASTPVAPETVASIPTASTPTPTAPLASAPIASAPGPSKPPERRATTKSPRPRPAAPTPKPSPTLPAPFDPDAPAPRVR